MQRPNGVFFLYGVLLCSVGVIKLIAPHTLTTLNGVPFVTVLRKVSPYPTLLFGTAWSVVAWGLLRLRKWARNLSVFLLGFGIFVETPMIRVRPHSDRQLIFAVFELVLKAVAVFYLIGARTQECFGTAQPPRSST